MTIPTPKTKKHKSLRPPQPNPHHSHPPPTHIHAGRSVKADVQLFQGEGGQNTVSRRHAQLRVEGAAVKVEDLVREKEGLIHWLLALFLRGYGGGLGGGGKWGHGHGGGHGQGGGLGEGTESWIDDWGCCGRLGGSSQNALFFQHTHSYTNDTQGSLTAFHPHKMLFFRHTHP